MKRITTHLLALFFAVCAASVPAKSQDKPQPTFSLTIEEQPLSAENVPGTHIISVTYTNISDAAQKDDCVVTPWAYQMQVLCDGVPVEKRKHNDEARKQQDEDNRPQIHVTMTEKDSCHGTRDRIPPGKNVKFTLWATAQYDMSEPGAYDITVTRETDPWNPEKGVTIKSNSITIVVPPPADGASPNGD